MPIICHVHLVVLPDLDSANLEAKHGGEKFLVRSNELGFHVGLSATWDERDITLLNLFYVALAHDNTEIDQKKSCCVGNAGHHALLPMVTVLGGPCTVDGICIVDHQPKPSQNHQSPKKGKS